MAKLKHFSLGVLCLVIFVLNTIIFGGLICIFVPVKLLSATLSFRNWVSARMVQLAETWISVNSLFMKKIHHVQWDVSGIENLSFDKSYLISANHQSWVDIPVLQEIFNRRIPFIRFFLKSQLLYVPILGGAWWALDFPFMKRHSRQYLSRHPEKRGEDFKTIRKTCAKFKNTPTSILNFLEGTRFTRTKHEEQKSNYQNLLNPKVGGLAFVLNVMGEQFDSLLDVTIFYPNGTPNLWDLLSGKLQKIAVRVERWPIPPELTNSHHLKTEKNRKLMHEWIREIWANKDRQLKLMAK
ncbi:MAG: acyltransferase [Bdellovibrionales bacterium]|nr:acyltransferase [Bdellovibrionales bacterium]